MPTRDCSTIANDSARDLFTDVSKQRAWSQHEQVVPLLFLHSRKLKTGNTASHVLVDFAGLNDSIMDTAVIKLLTLVVLMDAADKVRI